MPDSSSAPNPLLSFVIVGKNDDYMGNYQWRVNTALNLLVQGLVSLGREHQAEIVFCDWNSDEPFHKTMRLLPEARDLVRFVVVPPDIARPLQQDARFANCFAHNIAIRRSRGTFVSVTDADIVFMPPALETMFRILEGHLPLGVPLDRCFMVSHRRQLPVVRTFHNPSLAETAGFLRRNASLLHRDPLMAGIGVPAGIALLHRDLWEATGAYDERLIHGGWIDVDLHLRMSQKFPWIDLTNFGVETVHIEHYSAPRGTTASPRKFNGYPVSRRFAANDENWGLRNTALEIHAPQAVLDDAASAEIVKAAELARVLPTSVQGLVGELQLPEVTKIVENVLRALPHPGEEIDLIRILAWYGLKRRPRTYLELGVQNSSAPAIITAGCTTCETYLVDQWAEDDTGGNPPVYRASNIAAATNPQAACHIVSADPATAVQRLFEQVAPGLRLDLALIRTDARFGNAVQNAMAIADRITPGGGIAVSSSTAGQFAEVWNALAPRFANNIQFQIRQSQSAEARMGFILAMTPTS